MSPTWWRTDAVEWQSHDWQLELRGDEIAEVRHRGAMLLRGVRAAVRDRGWQTVPVTVERLHRGEDTLTLDLRHEGFGALVTSTLTVRAAADQLAIEWDAVNEVDLDTCRMGLVALHPATDTGRAVTVIHSDGSEEQAALPREISPHQPFTDIRELRIDSGGRMVFSGDVFEMEDQRNWSDASFKTYSRPLALPYPYAVPAGERVRQSIVIGAPVALVTGSGDRSAAVIELTDAGRFPAVGVEASTAPDPVPASSIGAFRVVQLDLATPNWRAALARAAADGPPLDVRVVSSGERAQVHEAAQALIGLPLARVAIFDDVLHVTTPEVAAVLREALAAAGLTVPVIGGTRSHFTELNREQAAIPRDVDGIAFTTTPLFHSLDTEQLVEALAMQRLIAEQAVRIAGGGEVHIGPVALRPRFNNVATTPQPAPTLDDLSAGYGSAFTGGVDERQRSPELGAWVIASAAALAVPGVATLSWFETWGPRGLADTSATAPAAEAIAALGALAGTQLLSGASPDGLIWAIGGRPAEGEGVAVLAANLDSVPRMFDVLVHGRGAVRISLGPGSWSRTEI